MALTVRQQWIVAALLVALLVVTRGHHFPTLTQSLPSASWAVFFLAGFYVRSVGMLPLLLAACAMVDFVAIEWAGVSDFCVSNAYVALIPAYGALWAAGRWLHGRFAFDLRMLARVAVATLASAFACELISSGSFYFFSGRFPETTLIEFGHRLVKYFPDMLTSMAFWVAAATIAHSAIGLWNVRTAGSRA